MEKIVVIKKGSAKIRFVKFGQDGCCPYGH